jgi:predicted MFS family arabinose efflux permease
LSGATARTLPLLIAASFAAGSGMRIFDPILPVVAADFGVTVAQMAPVLAGFMLAYGLGQIVIGPLGDRLGKLRVLLASLFLYAVALAASSAATGLWPMAGLRFASGAAAGAVFPLAMAWIGDTVAYAERQATIGKLLTGMVFAQLLAAPVTGIVAEAFGWRAAFLLLAAVSALVGLVLLVRLGRALAPPERGTASGLGLAAYARIWRDAAARRLLTATYVDGFVLFGGGFPFVGAYLIQEFGLSPARAGLITAAFSAGAFLYTRQAKRFLSLLGERGLVLTGGLALAAGYLGLALAPGWWAVLVLMAAFGLSFFLYHGVLQARATEVVPEARGTAVGAFAMALFLGQFSGSLVMAQVLAALGYRGTFAVAAAIMLGLALWTRWALFRRAA